MTSFLSKSLRKIRKYPLYLVLGILVLLASVDAHRKGISQEISQAIPSPEEAAQKAAQLTPEQLTSVEIDEVMRDRLRFDPRWQPILLAVREDIDTLKWTNTKVENLKNPIWKRYGAKVYPLLDYYTRFGDPLRQKYGITGIRSLGKPYTTLWLAKQLKLRQIILYENQEQKREKSFNFLPFEPEKEILEKEFGLDNPAIRHQLVKLAKENLEPKTSIYYQDQFNLVFLDALGEANRYSYVESLTFDPDSVPALKKWDQFEKLPSLDSSQIQEIVSYYRSLPTQAQEYILIERLAPIKAGEIQAAGKALFQNLATDKNYPYRMLAIGELDRHGDPQGTALLKEILNGDLSPLYPLTTLNESETGYRYQDILNPWAFGDQAYFLMLAWTENKYRDSKFSKGCREFGDLRGVSYFGRKPRSQEIQNRNAVKTPAQWVQDWQQWLSRYPDHPGADDAIYFLALNLQAENDVLGAMRNWMKLMMQSPGDGDALELAWPHVRSLLDVGLSVDQLETLVAEQRNSTIAPLLEYNLAVRYARQQDYAKALQISQGLDLTKMPTEVLGSYYNSKGNYYIEADVTKLQKNVQVILTEQRQRWQKLHNWQTENTPESRYRIAANWSSPGGWKNGYLPIWDQDRVAHLPIFNFEACQTFWTCEFIKQRPEIVRSRYQSANQNAVALSLYEKILADPQTPPNVREKTLYMIASTLFAQWEWHPEQETIAIHPPSGVSGESQIVKIWQETNPLAAKVQAKGKEEDQREDPNNPDRTFYRMWREFVWANEAQDSMGKAEEAIKADYQRRIDQIIAQLKQQFPQSPYIDDLLFSSYFLSRKPSYLEEIVKQYPKGDRATDAAKFLKYIK
jgi:hypothetical protein